MNVFESYFHHLAQSPERIDSLWMWTLCTVICWLILFKYRSEIMHGLKGANGLFENGEIVTFISIWSFPPILFRVAFFKESSDTQLIALYINSGIMIYQLTGRYIFDWALAIRTGGKITNPVEPEKTEVKTETTTTVVKQ